MNTHFYTVAVLTAKEGRLADLKAILEVLAQKTRKESGAVEYFFIQDQNHNSNTIVSYEKWINAEEENKHWETPHLKQAIEQFDEILDGPPIVYKGPIII